MSNILKLIIIFLILFIVYNIKLYFNIKSATFFIIFIFYLFIGFYNKYITDFKTIYFILSVMLYALLMYLIYTNQYFNVTSSQTPWYIILLISSIFILIGSILFTQYKYFNISIFILIGFVIFMNYFFKYILDFFSYLSDPDNTTKSYIILGCIGFILLLGIIYYFKPSGFNGSTGSKYIEILKSLWFNITDYIEDIWIYLSIEYEDINGYELLTVITCLIILIFLLFYKQLYHYFIYLNKGTYLIRQPIILSEETTLDYTPQFQYEYALSTWIWFNSTHSTNRVVPILDYGECPLIQYDTETNKINVIFLNENKVKTKIVSSKVQLQKWNHIVINNVGGTVDVFINGTLIKTVNNIIPINSTKNIIIGSSNGISGGLSNLMYFNQPLTIHQIQEIYSYTPKY